MSKKIKGEDGKIYEVKTKKPWYKRWWVWVLVVIAAIFIIGAIAGGGDDDDDDASTASKPRTHKVQKKKAPSNTDKNKASSRNSKPMKQKVPTEYKNALATAEEYNEDQPMSKAGLLDQLTSSDGEGFTQAAGEYAVNHLKANWNENALKCAKTYQKEEHLSRADVQSQLSSSIDDGGEGFTSEQVQYAMSHLKD